MGSPRDGCLRILLVEDNAADVTLARMALKQAGVNSAITVLADGDAAIEYIRACDQQANEAFDLILLDMNLPKCDGQEILECVQSTANYGQTPVIVMTASDAPWHRQEIQKQATVRYFRKSPALAEYMQLGVVVREAIAGQHQIESPTAAPSAAN